MTLLNLIVCLCDLTKLIFDTHKVHILIEVSEKAFTYANYLFN